jgi:BirA family biotin operon repressor/biotin-[acetyl-CoA-carboxylase] ligase
MQKNTLENTLISSGIQTWRAYKSIGSTNDEALAWFDEEAPDFSLVIAEEQTSGRGRFDRLWISKAGACLAFSLILRPRPEDHPNLALYAPLCGIAVRDALAELFDLDIQIKWPNDVLISRRKCCGIWLNRFGPVMFLKGSSWASELTSRLTRCRLLKTASTQRQAWKKP